jgi:methylmalonyl-CoA mutase, N-terminal domain
MGRLKPRVKELYRATMEGRNTQRAVIEAAKEGMTVGECVGVIRVGYGVNYDPFREIEMPDFVREIAEE